MLHLGVTVVYWPEQLFRGTLPISSDASIDLMKRFDYKKKKKKKNPANAGPTAGLNRNNPMPTLARLNRAARIRLQL